MTNNGERTLPLTDSLSKYLHWPEMGQTKARGPGLNPDPHMSDRGLLPPIVSLIRELKQGAEMGLKSRHSWDVVSEAKMQASQVACYPVGQTPAPKLIFEFCLSVSELKSTPNYLPVFPIGL